MSRDLIRLMHVLFPPAELGGAWVPAADVYRTRRGWLVKMELAGVRPEDITVEYRGSRLRIRGSRRDCALEEGCCQYHMEIAYSDFERTLELPFSLERCRIDTEFNNGMLLLHIQPPSPLCEAEGKARDRKTEGPQ
jgi:HSP20 family protein